MRVASGTQRGRHARAQAQARYKLEEGKRDTAREAGSLEFGFATSRSFQEADVSSSVRDGAKMDAKAVVLKELEKGRNSDKLANGLSLLTSL